jgi:hypothetical protein
VQRLTPAGEIPNADDERTLILDPDSARRGDLGAAGSGRAIRECEEPGWMQDRADPRAHKRASDIARHSDARSLSQEFADPSCLKPPDAEPKPTSYFFLIRLKFVAPQVQRKACRSPL